MLSNYIGNPKCFQIIKMLLNIDKKKTYSEQLPSYGDGFPVESPQKQRVKAWIYREKKKYHENHRIMQNKLKGNDSA